MKYILSAALVAATLCASSQEVFHDANAQVRKVNDFTAIEVSSAVELQLSQGSENAVAVSVQGKGEVEAIKTVVENGVLKIWYDQKKWYNNHARARAYVSAKALNAIRASGAAEVNVNGELNTSSLSIHMSGASDLKGTIRSGSLDIDLSGASDVSLNGSATDLKVEVSGASHLKGYDFVADNCLIGASGASDVKLTANKVINAQASGASSVSYKGQGQEGKIRSSGASSISRKG